MNMKCIDTINLYYLYLRKRDSLLQYQLQEQAGNQEGKRTIHVHSMQRNRGSDFLHIAQ